MPEIDPLAQSVDDIDISYPLLPASNYPMHIKEATVGPNKAGTGDTLTIKWVNSEEQQSTKGDAIAPGQIVLTSYIGLTEKPSRVENGKTIRARVLLDIQKDFKRLFVACGKSSITPADVKNNPSMIAGWSAIVKVSVRAETTEYPESNEVKGYVIEG